MKNKSSLFYWDTSALLALLFLEAKTTEIRKYVKKQKALPGYTSFFTLIEMESGLARRISEGSITTEDLPEIRVRIQELEQALGLIWPEINSIRECRRVINEYGLKPGDAIQLVSGLSLSPKSRLVTFVSLDQKLNQAATASDFKLPW